MIKTIYALVVFVLIGFSSLTAFADGIPLEPSLQTMEGWQPVRDRNVIITFKEYEFKHHILTLPAPHPKCDGVRVKGREAWLLTPEANPYLYMIELEPNAYRKRGDTEWEGAYGKTSGKIKDYEKE